MLGEEFDRDPFLIFRMRGMDREDLLGPEFRRSALKLEGPALPAEPLPAQPGEFWSNPLTALRDKDHAGPAVIPDMAGALPRQLSRFPLWRGNRELLPALQDIYRAASRRAVELHIGPVEPHDNPAPESEEEQARDTTAAPVRRFNGRRSAVQPSALLPAHGLAQHLRGVGAGCAAIGAQHLTEFRHPGLAVQDLHRWSRSCHGRPVS